MNSNLVIKDDNLENVVEFKRPALLKPDGDLPDENWLAGLPHGTVFFSQAKNASKQYVLDKFVVINHGVSVTELVQFLATGQQVKYGVITLEFSRGNKLLEIIEVLDMHGLEQQQGASHEQDDEQEGSSA